MATGDIISAQDAYQLGMVNRIIPFAELDSTVDALATRLAASPRVALAKIKAGLNQAAESDLANAPSLRLSTRERACIQRTSSKG